MATNLETIEANGLLAELAYLTLESKYYQDTYGRDYSTTNIIDYLKNTNINQIKIEDPDYFTNIVGNDNDKTADDYRGISSHRKDAMLEILDKYEIKK
ncbi:MAG: hypothetical protein CL624_11260 [Arcobacter sp.]|jgi:hypothetical protein|nr:hypothetical protein [Arcobacter sp.]|tara:strand:+ start:7248 stop:7541 length:294 start_codon:yes stop_codon:yes gene_type:complete